MSEVRKTSGWIFVAVGTVVLIGMICGTVYFNWLWRTHDDKAAQTEGVLLAFIVSGVSALITLGFIYLTRRSLEAAQDAISLQEKSLAATERLIDLERDSLNSAREAIYLQREQWNQQLRSDPQFWLTKSAHPLGAPLILATNGGPTLLFKHSLDLYVWNSAEQSFRVTAVELAPQASIQARWYRPQGFVVKGQHIEKIDAREFNHLLAQLLVDLGCANPIANDIRLAIKIRYRTWEHAEKVTEACYFIIKSGSRLAELTVTEE